MIGPSEILSGDSLEKRDFFIFQRVQEAYNAEFQRIQSLDNKSNYIIGFVGLLLSIDVLITTFLIDKLDKMKWYNLSILLLIIISLGLLLLSIYFALHAIKIRTWTYVPNTEHLLNTYTQGDKSYHETLVKITLEFAHAINENQNNNQSKAETIQKAINSLTLGITLFFGGAFISFILLIFNF